MSRYKDMTEPKREPAKTADDELLALEKDTLNELDAAKQSFRERMREENKRFADMCDTEYWCCICFQNRDQREELMRRLGIAPDEKYIDGREFAKAINRALKTPDMEMKRTKPFDRDYMAMSGL